MVIYNTESTKRKVQRAMKRPNNLFVVALGVGALLLVSLGVYRFWQAEDVEDSASHVFKVSPGDAFETPISLLDDFYVTQLRVYDEILPKETLSQALRRLRIAGNIAEKFTAAINKSVNLKLLRPNTGLMIERQSANMQLGWLNEPENHPVSDVLAIELFIRDEAGVASRIRASLDADKKDHIKVDIYKPKIEKEHGLLSGVVTNSIYSAIVNNNGDAQLVNGFSDIFNSQFDFYRDTREGDFYQMIVEKNLSDGRFVGFGKILAAEYTSGGKTLRGFYFESTDRQVSGFFDDKGFSLKNAFLKAPLKLASISSRFGMRFHPVQKRMKPHNGVDYGANRGTPFMSVASGTVVNAGYSPFNGNWVRVRHPNGYETEYLHATHLAKGVHVGARVKQGQIIGYVGKTGLASGYHLHFGMKQHGKYVNPAAQKFARSVGVPAKYMGEFKRNIEALIIALNQQSPDRQKVLASK